MKHLVEINDRTREGKAFLSLLKEFTLHSNAVSFLSKIEEVSDLALVRKMRAGLKSGIVSRDVVLKNLEKILTA